MSEQGHGESYKDKQIASLEYALANVREKLTASLSREAALVEALKRLGSMEAFTVSHAVSNTLSGKELQARIDYARAAAAQLQERTEQEKP